MRRNRDEDLRFGDREARTQNLQLHGPARIISCAAFHHMGGGASGLGAHRFGSIGRTGRKHLRLR
jgi:hypothetical protein